MKFDACIIGCGPSGAISAEILASRGFKTAVFEEHPTIGVPNHCAGLISVKGLDRLGIDPAQDFIQNKVLGGRVYSPEGDFIEIKDSKPRAFVIDRTSFDSYLAERAEDKGALLYKNTRVNKLNEHKIETKNASYETGLTIDAEGSGGKLLLASGYNYSPPTFITGFNTEVENVELNPDIVEIWFDEDISGGFFAWVIPVTADRARVGLGTKSEDGLEKLLKFVKRRFANKKYSTIRAGQICTGGPVRRTVYESTMLVGDVAGQVKATTGGGVVIGGLCAKIAGEVASDHLAGKSSLIDYERQWRGEYGFELKTMCSLRTVMNKIDNERFNSVFNIMKKEKIEDRLHHLLETGDMDMQSGVIRKALLDPKILSILVRGLGRMALTELLAFFR
ncbi:geranylgeranyl reductase family protein [Candidatus Bathyarchaeota archaeon]|nr:geranylgeranyl reductase family protein [Candidatus Bathyarchaeota archaeon]